MVICVLCMCPHCLLWITGESRQASSDPYPLENEGYPRSDDSFWRVIMSLKNITENRLQARAIGTTMVDKVKQ